MSEHGAIGILLPDDGPDYKWYRLNELISGLPDISVGRIRSQGLHEAASLRALVRKGGRIPIEGKFGQGKGGYGLDKIPARRANTSEAWIRAIFLVMNLLALLKLLFWLCAQAGGEETAPQRLQIVVITLPAQAFRHSVTAQEKSAGSIIVSIAAF